MLACVRKTLRERSLLSPGQTVLVACSGGPDSTALVHVLHALRDEHGCALHVASVDHGLRPDAGRDVAVAQALADRLVLPFHALRVSVNKQASRQAAARDARYAALFGCAASVGATRIAVGHTRDDQAETVIVRLLRGTGVDGLSGIDPHRADGVIRPLIDCSRESVHAYVKAHGIACVIDPSNSDPRYLRSKVRLEVLPALERMNPQLTPGLAALADDARDLSVFMDGVADALIAAGGPLAKKLAEEQSPAVRRWALRRYVRNAHGIVLLRTHLDALDRMLVTGGNVRLPGDLVASCGAHGELVIEPTSKRGRGRGRRNRGDEK